MGRPVDLLLGVDIRAVVRRALQRVGRPVRRAELDARAVRVIVVRAVESAVQRLRRVGGVVERVEAVLERVVVQPWSSRTTSDRAASCDRNDVFCTSQYGHRQ